MLVDDAALEFYRSQLLIYPQPDETSCGPTCLHSIYNYYGDSIDLQSVISEVKALDAGGTLAVFLGCHALKRRYKSSIYTLNLHVFDPTWFIGQGVDLKEKLRLRGESRDDPRLRAAVAGYIEFLELGGKIYFRDLTISLIKNFLYRSIPIISGLNSTFLYRSMREFNTGDVDVDDDINGDSQGHFVVLVNYERRKKRILIADPYKKNPFSSEQYYFVNVSRLINSILLGIVTYDSSMLIIEPV